MNCSKTNELLYSIQSDTSELTTIDTSLSNINSNTATNTLTLNNIASNTDTINSNVSAIKTDVDTLAKKKIIFNARLTDGTNNYLARSDYSGVNGINFYWSNNLGSTAYIYKYVFTYEENTEPDRDQLYHSTAWDSKIGALNSSETDYEAPYIVVSDNHDYMTNISAGAPKNSWISNNCFVFQKDFNEAPIEIGVSRKFGHYINGDFDDTNLYDSDPVGIVEGFYYES